MLRDNFGGGDQQIFTKQSFCDRHRKWGSGDEKLEERAINPSLTSRIQRRDRQWSNNPTDKCKVIILVRVTRRGSWCCETSLQKGMLTGGRFLRTEAPGWQPLEVPKVRRGEERKPGGSKSGHKSSVVEAVWWGRGDWTVAMWLNRGERQERKETAWAWRGRQLDHSAPPGYTQHPEHVMAAAWEWENRWLRWELENGFIFLKHQSSYAS